MARTKERFEKGCEQTFSEEIFIVAEIVRRGQIPVYRLLDYDRKAIEGTFCPKELQTVNSEEDRIYKIERTIAAKGKGRKKQLLMKWHGRPPKFNS
ncbi:ef-hand calcium-binding domain-containing protein 6 [Limosa lapponica baueri]|uniref:Ef-hand calcium-binding domain-containing protein 6 n=1 Tax=Limosa lapponica baueri TaxID=1758121 RepID=A0A2I0TIY6_LIMLA|nr:ef-hand calcium-binding domain-containing protein 6 [Limosa lapponica baueri]